MVNRLQTSKQNHWLNASKISTKYPEIFTDSTKLSHEAARGPWEEWGGGGVEGRKVRGDGRKRAPVGLSGVKRCLRPSG